MTQPAEAQCTAVRKLAKGDFLSEEEAEAILPMIEPLSEEEMTTLHMEEPPRELMFWLEA